MDGDTWNVIQMYYSELIPTVVARGTIFSRFRPEQKSQIVLCLQKFDYIVAMCGDGANDCGALRVSSNAIVYPLAVLNTVSFLLCFSGGSHWHFIVTGKSPNTKIVIPIYDNP